MKKRELLIVIILMMIAINSWHINKVIKRQIKIMETQEFILDIMIKIDQDIIELI